jgi:excisionase family DNA binding protein
MRPPPRPAQDCIHGLSGPVGIIGGPEASALLRFRGLHDYQRRHRGANPDLDRATAVLRLVSAAYRARRARLDSECGTSRAKTAEPVKQSSGGQLTTREAGEVLGITDRAVRQAIKEGRLAAESIGGRWLIKTEDVTTYRVH